MEDTEMEEEEEEESNMVVWCSPTLGPQMHSSAGVFGLVVPTTFASMATAQSTRLFTHKAQYVEISYGE